MKYRKKPLVIEAIQWTGDNILDVIEFMYPTPPIHLGAQFKNADDLIAIDTREGRMVANKGDWIIRGIQGELYPCSAEIFAATYEQVEDTQ